MKEKIATNAEIKALLGITSTSQDAQVEMWNNIATEQLCDLFGVDNLTYHLITNERVDVYDPEVLYLEVFPVDASTVSLKDTQEDAILSGYSFYRDPHNLRTVRIKDPEGNPVTIGYSEVLATYSGGYIQKDTITVASITALVGKTLNVKVAVVTTEWTFVSGTPATDTEIEVGVDEDATAANIASELGGTSSGAVATLPLGSFSELGTATTSQLTIVNNTIPEPLKMAIALMAGSGLRQKDRVGGVSSYRIGSKQVNFASESDKNTFVSIMTAWLPYYKQVTICT